MGIVRDLGLWLWHLLPGNPILVRVVMTGGKRVRHLWARIVYLLALFVVLFVVGQNVFATAHSSLADLAKQSTQTFMYVSIVQLFLMCFIAPVFTAAAITQEKDANTFNILLTTPLSSAQIVIGSLFSRIYFVWVLLLAGLPIFCITMIFGGVTIESVFNSFALSASTALLTGSLAILISVAKVGTRRTIFSFFLGVAVYLLALLAIGLSPWGTLAEAPFGPRGQMSWLAPVHPFLALYVVTGQTPPPPIYAVEHYGWPWAWMLAKPHAAYVVLTTLASVVLIGLSLFFVRRGLREGELTLVHRIRGFFMRGDPAVEKRRKPRHVWNDPIAWREAATRASAGGRSMMRWVFIAAGVLMGVVLLIAHEKSWWGMAPATPAAARWWLTALVWIELAAILLVVTNTAASSLTRERESESMELLLTTPLTSKSIFRGMLRGLVSFVIPMISVPTVTLLLFVVADLLRRGSPPVTTWESFLLAPVLLTMLAALAAMIGLHFSLNCKKTVQAVMVSTGIVMIGAGLLAGCGYAVASSNGHFAAFIQSFTPLHAMQIIIDPIAAFAPPDRPKLTPDDLQTARLIRAVGTLVAAFAYALITWQLHASIVRSFDMTVRRQSA